MKKDSQFSLTAAMKQLEAINLWFQGETVDLDEALTKLQEAHQLTKQIKARLTEVENKFIALKQDFQPE